MRILALDPGYERLGIALIEQINRKETLLYSDCFQTKSSLTFPERLHLLGEELEKLFQEYEPEVLAIEKLYFNSNQKTAMAVSQMRGMAIYLAKKYKMDVFEYTPGQIKSAVTGYGKSTKKQIITMVPKLISVEKDIKYDDEFDAIAVGLTCFASERF
ncbi:MAG: crossover junction endodeoxyribonuclease RuvC [Candidatus Paceibacterota bacterium]